MLLTTVTHVADGDEGLTRARRLLQGALVVVGHSVGSAHLLGWLFYPGDFFHLNTEIYLRIVRLIQRICC